MKKLLIIQQDEAYFLFETIQVLEKNLSAFKDFELTILVNDLSYKKVYSHSNPIIKGITTNSDSLMSKQFDLAVNLSLEETSWVLHGKIKSNKKIGPYSIDGETFVDDLWSSYLMTLKAKAPFLTFHLQDVYKNILGIKSSSGIKQRPTTYNQIVIGTTSTQLFSANEQESLIYELALTYPHLPLKDLSEIDFISDLSQSFYIGPANLEALKFCAAGGRGLFLTSAFQGFNLIPYEIGNTVVSSKGGCFTANEVIKLVDGLVTGHAKITSNHSVYSIVQENVFGPVLKNHNQSDDSYPFYQSHLVLWNFLLNLFETNLPVPKCTSDQFKILSSQHEILKKYIRLHDYAMVSIDTIYQQAKAKTSDRDKIEGHLKNLIEIDGVSDQIAASHPMLRPVIDFYRIRRGQNRGKTLSEQSQHSYLIYSEEHQALEALSELFSVTLKENTVNI